MTPPKTSPKTNNKTTTNKQTNTSATPPPPKKTTNKKTKTKQNKTKQNKQNKTNKQTKKKTPTKQQQQQQTNKQQQPNNFTSGADVCAFSHPCDRLVGLMVRRLTRERKIPGSNPACARIFSGSSHTSDLKIGTLVDTLPGAWRYRVSAGTGRPGVSIL